MPDIIVKTIVKELDYYKEKYNTNGSIVQGVLHNVGNEIVYWYKSDNGYEKCLTKQEADLLIEFMITYPIVFDINTIEKIDCDDNNIKWDNVRCPIPLNSKGFIQQITNYNLPFDSIGRRNLIV